MQTDVDELRTRLDTLTGEFDRAKQTIRKLEAGRSSHLPFRQLLMLGCAMVAVVAVSSWLSAQPGATTFKAPFMVTDSAGKTIFAVSDRFPHKAFGSRGALVFSPSGDIVAGIFASGSGGVVKVAKEGEAGAYAFMSSFSFVVRDGDKQVVVLTEGNSRLPAPFEVFDANGKTVFKTNDKSE